MSRCSPPQSYAPWLCPPAEGSDWHDEAGKSKRLRGNAIRSRRLSPGSSKAFCQYSSLAMFGRRPCCGAHAIALHCEAPLHERALARHRCTRERLPEKSNLIRVCEKANLISRHKTKHAYDFFRSMAMHPIPRSSIHRGESFGMPHSKPHRPPPAAARVLASAVRAFISPTAFEQTRGGALGAGGCQKGYGFALCRGRPQISDNLSRQLGWHGTGDAGTTWLGRVRIRRRVAVWL